MLLFTAAEIETASVGLGLSPGAAGLLGGMGGGIAQAYATMGAAHFPETLYFSTDRGPGKASALA